MNDSIVVNKQFAEDVRQGLQATPKRLPSKYFYDARGDELFQAIMHLPEYYLTRAEFEIMQMNAPAFLKLFQEGGRPFNLIEFGAGDGMKTKILLRHFLKEKADFRYMPIDISGHVLQLLQQSLADELPDLEVAPIENDYFRALKDVNERQNGHRNIVLFMGGNIGNFSGNGAEGFLKQLSDELKPGDGLLIGIDLKKDPDRIRAAYNDSQGVTRAFNFNLLERMNRELGANFNVQQFKHVPTYDPLSGEARSFLMSTVKQQVYIEALDESFSFDAWEPIHTEVSKKYSLKEIEQLAKVAGFQVVEHVFDCRHDFVDSYWQKI